MKKKVNYRFGEIAISCLERLKAKLGLSDTAIIELALLRLAELEALSQVDVDNKDSRILVSDAGTVKE